MRWNTSRLFQTRHLCLLCTVNHFIMFLWWSGVGASLLSKSFSSKQPAERNGDCAASESSDSLGASPGPFLCFVPSSSVKYSEGNRHTDGKHVIKRRKRSLSEAGQHFDPTEASAHPGASFGTSGLTMSSSSYVTLPGGPLPTSPGTPL